MPDNSQTMPTLSPEEGLDEFRSALTAVQSKNQAIVCYHDGDDPTNADEDWLENHRKNGSFPEAAAVLIPVSAWNEYATLRNQNTGVETAELALQLKQAEQQLNLAAMEPRLQAVKLALDTVHPSANSQTTYTAAMLKNANDIHKFLTEGTVPEGGLTHVG